MFISSNATKLIYEVPLTYSTLYERLVVEIITFRYELVVPIFAF